MVEIHGEPDALGGYWLHTSVFHSEMAIDLLAPKSMTVSIFEVRTLLQCSCHKIRVDRTGDTLFRHGTASSHESMGAMEAMRGTYNTKRFTCSSEQNVCKGST